MRRSPLHQCHDALRGGVRVVDKHIAHRFGGRPADEVDLRMSAPVFYGQTVLDADYFERLALDVFA